MNQPITREKWLRQAVEYLDADLFGGALDLLNHKYQITCGRCPGQKLADTIQPYQGEDVKLEDFFPTTISVSHTMKEPREMLFTLAYECIKAFWNIDKIKSKQFKDLANKYYFDAPFTSPHPTAHLESIIDSIYKKLVANHGEWPGEAVVIRPKVAKEKKKNSFTVFCPDCGYELKVSRKMLEKHQGTLPTCPCGTKMGLDLEEPEDGNETEA